MEWKLDGEAPIWAQIVETVKLGIVSGGFEPGERLPPVREMAMEAGVNPNTMQRALAELEREGLVYSQRTSGRFVTEDGRAIAAARGELAEAKIRAFLDSMAALGYSREEINGLVRDSNFEGGKTDGDT